MSPVILVDAQSIQSRKLGTIGAKDHFTLSGKVGINENAPVHALDVNGNVGADTLFANQLYLNGQRMILSWPDTTVEFDDSPLEQLPLATGAGGVQPKGKLRDRIRNTIPGFLSIGGGAGVFNNPTDQPTAPQHTLDIQGHTNTRALRVEGRQSGDYHDSGILMEVPSTGYNVIRGYSPTDEYLGAIHFFDHRAGATLQHSSGAVNVSGNAGVTIGPWNNPLMMLDHHNEIITIDSHVHISKPDSTDAPDWAEKYDDYLLWIEGGMVTTDYSLAEPDEWSDYVFDQDYALPALEEVETHILENGHLHTMPSEEEIVRDGYSLHDMNKRMLQTIEELTLHTINQEKQIAKQEQKLREQTLLMQQLMHRLEMVEKNQDK